MQTPFEILDVADDADDEAVKKAYLKKVREYPPEHSAVAFQRIRGAFEMIQTDKQRRKHRLFNHEKPDLQNLLRQTLRPGVFQRPDANTLLGALTEGVIDGFLKSQAIE
jgi:DnaJ-class molecular chaperone